jgi:hypothetical protein
MTATTSGMFLMASKQGRDAKSLCSTMQQVEAPTKSWPELFPGFGNATMVISRVSILKTDFQHNNNKKKQFARESLAAHCKQIL